jgi:hypothetical protein
MQAATIVDPFDELKELTSRFLTGWSEPPSSWAFFVLAKKRSTGTWSQQFALRPTPWLASNADGMSSVSAAVVVARGDYHSQCIEGQLLGDRLIHRPAPPGARTCRGRPEGKQAPAVRT